MRTCLDCKCDIASAYRNVIRCRDCQSKRRKVMKHANDRARADRVSEHRRMAREWREAEEIRDVPLERVPRKTHTAAEIETAMKSGKCGRCLVNPARATGLCGLCDTAKIQKMKGAGK